jgi:DNA-binding transcriptional LysR family regulator
MRSRRPPPLPLNAIKAFEVAARHESFAAAAEELHVTAAAVSRHVKLLESILDRQLFERRPQSLALTPFGRAWLPALTDAFNLIESSIARALRPQPPATVSLSVQTAFAVGWLMPRLARFYHALPHIALRLYTHTETPDLLAEKRFDAMIVSGRGVWQNCEASVLIPNQMVPVCSPGFLVQRPYLQRPTDLLSEPLIVSEANPEDWRDWFASVGLKHVGIADKVAFPTGFLPAQAAIHGLGIALADRALIDDDLRSGRLVIALPVPALARGTSWYVVTVPGRRIDEPFRQLNLWLREEAQKHAASPPPAGGR